MRTTRKFVKVFLASPGDLKDERIEAHDVVEELNRLHGESLGYHIELVGWEDVISQSQRPQAAINRDLDQCELFIGMLWERWGTPPDNSGNYELGFEEEFERSATNYARVRKPEICLLFKDVESSRLRDPGEQLKKVMAFRERLIAEKKILFETFADTRTLGQKVRAIITKYLYGLIEDESAERTRKSQETLPSETDRSSEEDQTLTAAPDRVFSNEGAEFIQSLLVKSAHATLSSLEAARFRLLGTMVGTYGNDLSFLGAHDANLLFAHHESLVLGEVEILGLVSAGLSNFAMHNTPLWHWIKAADRFSPDSLFHYTIVGPDDRRIGAIKAMTFLRMQFPIGGSVVGHGIVELWLNQDNPKVLVAALEYLGACGLPEHLPSVRKEFDRSNYNTKELALRVLLQITAKEKRQDAISLLLELQPESVDLEIVDSLFENDALVDSEVVRMAINHRNSSVRAASARILESRNEIDVSLAEKLLKDPHSTVRHVAMVALHKAGRKFSQGEAWSLLVKSRGGVFAIGANKDFAGERELEQFLDMYYATISLPDLENEIKKISVYNLKPWIMYHARQYARLGQELRLAIEDNFKNLFEELQSKSKNGNVESQVQSAVDEFLRKKFTRFGLTVICRRGIEGDLAFVRRVLNSGAVAFDESEVEYLRIHGKWADIPLLIQLSTRANSTLNLLMMTGGVSHYRQVASAMVSISRNRIPELLKSEMSSWLLAHVIAHVSDAAFAKLPQSSIVAVLYKRVRECAEVRRFQVYCFAFKIGTIQTSQELPVV